MIPEAYRVHEAVASIALVASGLLVGWLFDVTVFRALRNWTNAPRGLSVAFASLHGTFLVWGGAAGADTALRLYPPPPAMFTVAERTLLVIVVATTTLVAARLTVALVNVRERGSLGRFPAASLLESLIYIFVFAIGLLVVLDALGISIAPLLTALGVGGLAVALALKDTLANLFAGMQIIASRQINRGDYVKLETSQEGYVIDIAWRNTTLRGLDDNLIVVPNEKIASAIFTNYHLPKRDFTLNVAVAVGYDSDLDLVERVTLEVAREVMAELAADAADVAEFTPFLRYGSFGESSIAFKVFLRTGEFVDQYAAQHLFIKRLAARYRQEKIALPYAQRVVHLSGTEGAT